MIDIIKNGERKKVTYEQFDDLFYVVNDTLDAALKEDCIFYRVVDLDILVKNYRGEELTISMGRFLSMYTI